MIFITEVYNIKKIISDNDVASVLKSRMNVYDNMRDAYNMSLSHSFLVRVMNYGDSEGRTFRSQPKDTKKIFYQAF